jgi:hypothetical protein
MHPDADAQANLATLQRQMQASILGHANGDVEVSPSWHGEIVSGNLNVTERLAIYRQNTLATHRNTLGALYPVVMRIVGEDFFQEAATQYIASTPSRSGDLHQYGAKFADFLARYLHANSLPYLPDMARLEWCWHLAFHAADSPVLDFARLHRLEATQLEAATFSLSPALSLLKSAHPLLQIWSANQPDYDGDWQINWEIKAAYFMVSRQAYLVQIHEVSEAQFKFLLALQNNANLAFALDVALTLDAEFDLPALLVICNEAALFSEFNPPCSIHTANVT